jgi:heme exporter protein D|tara:strand:- start:335 stop:568 length:234 start_codon:yes stop_codon:yes gene_type:complete
MIANFITMNGYGIFVWASFSIVFISCALVYIKTRKTLKKYERNFLLEVKNLPNQEKNRILSNSKIVQQILATSPKIK